MIPENQIVCYTKLTINYYNLENKYNIWRLKLNLFFCHMCFLVLLKLVTDI